MPSPGSSRTIWYSGSQQPDLSRIDDLTSGLEAIEELSRNDLGYIKQGETFYRIIPKDKDKGSSSGDAAYDD